MIDLCQYRRFYKLGVNEGRNHRDAWLIRIHDSALREGIQISVKAEIFKVCEKALRELVKRAEILHILLAEMQIFHVFDNLLQSRENRISAAVRIFPCENIENNSFGMLFILEITVCHSHFIKIHHHCDVAFCMLCHVHSSCFCRGRTHTWGCIDSVCFYKVST